MPDLTKYHVVCAHLGGFDVPYTGASSLAGTWIRKDYEVWDQIFMMSLDHCQSSPSNPGGFK